MPAASDRNQATCVGTGYLLQVRVQGCARLVVFNVRHGVAGSEKQRIDWERWSWMRARGPARRCHVTESCISEH